MSMPKRSFSHLLITAILFIGILVFTESCRKMDKFFETSEMAQKIDNYKKWLKTNGQNFSAGTIPLGIRADENIEGQLAWNNSRIYRSDADEIIVIPFTFETGSFSKTSRILPASESGTLPLMVDLYLKKNRTGKIEGFLKISAYRDNADKSLREKYTSTYTLDMKHIVDKQVVEGKIYRLITTGLSDYSQRTESDNCEEVSYTYSYIKECTGGMDNTACVFKKRTVTRYRCYGTMGGEEETIDWIDNDDMEGGGWSEYDDEEVEYANQTIIDSLQGYPCAQDILKQLPNLNNTTKAILQNVFGASTNFNVIFRADTTMPNYDNGATTRVVENSTTSTYDIKIRLNATMLKNASKEFILNVMLHESLHAFINYNLFLYTSNQVDSTTFKSQFSIIWKYKNGNNSQHIEISENYISALKQTILDFNNHADLSMAKAISWVGLQGTPAWLNLGNDTLDVRQNVSIAKYGTTSQMALYNLKKCNE